MKKYIKLSLFIVIIAILLLFIPPLVEGFDDCIIDTLANLKVDIINIKEDITKLKENETSQSSLSMGDASGYLNSFSDGATSQTQGISDKFSSAKQSMATSFSGMSQDVPANLEEDSKESYNKISNNISSALSTFK